MNCRNASGNNGCREILLCSDRFHQYVSLTRLNKPIGIFLLLWPTLWALWIASGGIPEPKILLVFISGVVLMRSAGCVINDYSDRHFDLHVQRTRQRPLASGRISTREALTIFALLAATAFMLVLLLNPMAIMLSFVAIVLAVIYPLMKRYTHFPQAVLGIAFAWAVPMVFSAVRADLPTTAWLLFFVTIVWTVAYDTMYAMVDREDDIRIGVKSTAIIFGQADRMIIAVLQVIVVGSLILLGYMQGFGIYYNLGVVCGAGLMLYQQFLIFDRDRDRCLRAFLNNNWFGAAIFAGIISHYWFFRG